MRRIVILALVAALCASLTACGSSAPASPKAVRASIVAAALAQKSVRWTENVLVPEMEANRTTADVTTDSGTQRIAYLSRTNKYDDVVQIRLVKHTVYLRGDAESLLQTLNGDMPITPNLTDAQARKYAGKWISIPQGNALYAQTADGLTLAAIVRDVTPHGKLTLAHGTQLRFVQANGNFQSLWASARGEPLPVGFTVNGCTGCFVNYRFSKWNEPVNVQAPAHSTPIATVSAG